MEVKSGGSGGPNQKNGNKGKKVTKFVSTVKVGEQSFQTFPNSYSTKEQAEEAASSFAISKFPIAGPQSPTPPLQLNLLQARCKRGRAVERHL